MYASKPIETAGDPVVISVGEYKEKVRLDIRHQYTTKAGELAPTKKGVSVVTSDVPSLLGAIRSVISGGAEKIDAKTSGYMPVFVTRNNYKGHELLDVRHYWLPQGKTKFVPSDKGVSIPIEQVAVFMTYLSEAAEECGVKSSIAVRQEEPISVPMTSTTRFASVEV